MTKSNKMDFAGLEIIADKFTGDITPGPSLTFSSLTGTVPNATGTTLQAILDDLASRVTSLEPEP